MLRRSLATLVLVLSLWVATLAWSGFLALRTVFDAERSRDVAASLYDDDAVRSRLEANVAGAVRAALPGGIPVTDAQLEGAAADALASPAVEALVVDAFAQTHAAFLGEGEAPDRLDAGAFGAAARAAVVASRPELDGVLPADPQLAVPLPTERVPDLGPVKEALETAVPVLAVVASAGVLFALLATSDRPRVVRRASFWALAMSAVVLVVAFGVPWLAGQVAPAQAEVVAALVGAIAASTTGPALALAGAGALGLVVAFAWARSPSPAASPSAPAVGSGRRRGGSPAPRPTGPSRTAPRPPVRARSAPSAAPTASTPAAPSGPTGPPPAPARPPPEPRLGGLAPRWVEGHGWVVDPASQQIPAEARWVAGVGYVVEPAPGEGRDGR